METTKSHACMFPIRATIALHLSLWNLGHEVKDDSIKHDLLNRTINIPSFIVFASRHVSCYEISETDMFQKHRTSIVTMLNGD